MSDVPETVVRNAYIPNGDAVVDIAIDDGWITAVQPAIADDGETELDADGDLVSPGLTDTHVHLDMALSATGDRLPRNNEEWAGRIDAIEKTADYFAEIEADDIIANVREVAEWAISNGVLHLRTHAYVDSTVGTDVVEAVATARDVLDDRLDIEIVAFSQQGIRRDEGSEAALRGALNAGADLVGGLDPATLNNDREGTIDTWFNIATEYDADLDVHIHERGAIGMETLESLAEQAIDRGYEGRVTASHAYALADAANGNAGGNENETEQSGGLDDAMETFEAADLRFITCYQSTLRGMPIRQAHDAGVVMAHGTDQVHDLWGAHGNVDALGAMGVESLKLDGYSTNEGLAHLWQLITTKGATVLGCEDTYGIEPGISADLVVHDGRSPQWAILEQSDPRYVFKGGCVVAADGTIESLSG